MAFFPWTRVKQLLKQPWMYYTAGFGLQYFCNDSAAVQKQGYGVITFVPYMAVFSILTVDFVFSWVKHIRRQETLPLHNQDIQMNGRQADHMQVGHTQRSSLSRQKNFNLGRPWMVKEEVEATSGNKQCVSSDAKDEVAEMKKPQQNVRTTKNKCTEARVWKSPELAKQDLTSSLASGSTLSQGGSTYSGTGVAARGNPRSARTESASKNDDVKDEVQESKIPLQHRSSSKNKQSIGSRAGSINNGRGVVTSGNRRRAHTESTSQNDNAKDEGMESKSPQQHRCPSKNKQSIVSRGGADNSGKGAATTANRGIADTESTYQNDDAKGEVMEAKNPQQHTFHSKNKQSRVSPVGYINSRRSVATTGNWRNANTGSASKKDDATGRIEWTNLQQPGSPSNNNCMHPARPLQGLQEPSLASRSGMGTGSGVSCEGLATGNT